MQGYADLCLVYAFKKPEIQDNLGSWLMCHYKEMAAATVCACLTVKHGAACSLTAHVEGNTAVATIYFWHQDLITTYASNVRPTTACQQIQHPPKPITTNVHPKKIRLCVQCVCWLFGI
jgi:hypothetical protein